MADESVDGYTCNPPQSQEFQEDNLCAVWLSTPSSALTASSDSRTGLASSRSSLISAGNGMGISFISSGIISSVITLSRLIFTALLATLSTAYVFHYWAPPALWWPLLMLFVPLLYLTRSLSLTGSRVHSLTFMPPLVFGLTLWSGAPLASISTLITCGLYARFGNGRGSVRSRLQICWQGGQYLIACNIAQVAMVHASTHQFATSAFASDPVEALAVATIGAVSFVSALFLLYAVSYFRTFHANLQRVASRAYMGRQALVMSLGLMPILLLAPFHRMGGLLIGLPLFLLLMTAGRVAQLQDTIESLRRQLRATEAMGRASIGDPDVVDDALLLQRFLALAHELVPATRSLVWILNKETGELLPEIALPDKGPFLRQAALFGEGLIGHAAARMVPRIVADASTDPHRDVREHAVGTWLLYPIVVREQLLGVAHWTRRVGRPFTQEDVAALASLVPQAAIALENVYIRAQMHDLAATDGLTGLWNHRHMVETLREELRRAVRYHRTVSILMIDVDSFKTFNDTYGHPQGDRLLRTVARILKHSVRVVDHVGRYGGEEFLIILPETGKDDACRLGERVRAEIEEQAYVIVDGRAIRRTISIGVASYPEDALNPEELVQRADEALYRAKRSGKNCVVWS